MVSDRARQQEIANKLYTCFEKKGFLTEDKVLALMISEKVSLVDINRITDLLVKMGVIFSETDDGDIYDRARIDYDIIYEEIVSISPGQKEFISLLKRVKPPQHREWKSLIVQMRSGNDFAFKRLFEMYLRVVVRIALDNSKSSEIELDDAIQEGSLGLIRGINLFDPSRHGNLGSYLAWWIQQYISRAIADRGRIIRWPVHFRETVDEIQKVKSRFLYYNNYEASVEVLAAEMDVSIEKIEETLEIIINTSNLLSIEELLLDEDDNSPINDPRNSYTIEDGIDLGFLRRDLLRQMQSFGPREKSIILRRFGFCDNKTHTLEEIGDEHHITRERVRQIEAKSLRKLRHPSRSKKLRDYY